MSQELAEQNREFLRQDALEIYSIFVENAGPGNWDWNPLAVKAFEAAEAFNAVYYQRYYPKTSGSETTPKTPVSDPSSGIESENISSMLTGRPPMKFIPKPATN